MSDDEDFTGLGLGLGFEHLVTKSFSVRLEAIRFDYSSDSFGGVKFDPVETSVDLMALFRF